MQRWSGHFDVSGSHPLPTVLVILGFIATFVVGLPLAYFEHWLGYWSMIVGVILIFIGIYLWYEG